MASLPSDRRLVTAQVCSLKRVGAMKSRLPHPKRPSSGQHMTESMICHVEKGRRLPSLDTIEEEKSRFSDWGSDSEDDECPRLREGKSRFSDWGSDSEGDEYPGSEEKSRFSDWGSDSEDDECPDPEEELTEVCSVTDTTLARVGTPHIPDEVANSDGDDSSDDFDDFEYKICEAVAVPMTRVQGLYRIVTITKKAAPSLHIPEDSPLSLGLNAVERSVRRARSTYQPLEQSPPSEALPEDSYLAERPSASRGQDQRPPPEPLSPYDPLPHRLRLNAKRSTQREIDDGIAEYLSHL